MRPLLLSILLSVILTNCPTENDPNLVEMTASVQPEEAGVVNPPAGTYEIGREITIATEGTEDRWEFAGWSGDTAAAGDTLTFVVTRDMELTANYEIPADERPVLTTAVQPEEAGTVNPDSGPVDYRSDVDVEAIPAEGWGFTEWSGDTAAAENPLSLTIENDYTLTAHFSELSFSHTITVSDGPNAMDLVFGMDTEATAGFDPGIDRELPPPPPDGSFYGQFNIPDHQLAEDYRPTREDSTIWELEVAPAGDRTITLSWDFADTDHVGTLTLTDDPEDPLFEVDMKSETSHEASEESAQILYIISENEH